MLGVKGKVAEEVFGGRQAAPLILETKENQSSFIRVFLTQHLVKHIPHV